MMTAIQLDSLFTTPCPAQIIWHIFQQKDLLKKQKQNKTTFFLSTKNFLNVKSLHPWLWRGYSLSHQIISFRFSKGCLQVPNNKSYDDHPHVGKGKESWGWASQVGDKHVSYLLVPAGFSNWKCWSLGSFMCSITHVSSERFLRDT